MWDLPQRHLHSELTIFWGIEKPIVSRIFSLPKGIFFYTIAPRGNSPEGEFEKRGGEKLIFSQKRKEGIAYG